MCHNGLSQNGQNGHDVEITVEADMCHKNLLKKLLRWGGGIPGYKIIGVSSPRLFGH